MFYFYILQSAKDQDLYSGFTNDLRNRIKEHNSSRVTSTKSRTPFKLVYYEAYADERDARNREKQIKLRAQAFTGLRRRIKFSTNRV